MMGYLSHQPACRLAKSAELSEIIEWAVENLPENISIIAAHPLFGPTSTANGTNFRGLRWVTHAARLNNKQNYEILTRFLMSQGLNIIEMDPTEHDKLAARSQAYVFLLGQIGTEMKVINTPIDTRMSELILENQATVEKDTDELFRDMFKYNRFTKQVIEDFEHSLTRVKKGLESKPQ